MFTLLELTVFQNMSIMKILKSLLLITTLLLCSLAQAQNQNPFKLPATIPIPGWVEKVDWQNVNVRQIEKLISDYKKSEEFYQFEKQDSEASTNSPFQKQESEEPYETAFIRWKMQMKMEQAIQSDGTVNPDKENFRLFLQQELSKQHSQSNSRITSSGNWTILGPIETFGPNNSGPKFSQVNIYCFAIAPSNPNILYCSSETGGTFKTTDKGLNWVSVADALPAQSAQSIAIDFNNPDIVYGKYSDNILKTVDGGVSWNLLSGYSGGYGEKIITLPTNNTVLTVGGGSVHYSLDDGATWFQSAGISGAAEMYDIQAMAGSKDTLYASGKTGSGFIKLYRSVDAGLNFTDVTGSNSIVENTGSRFAVSPADKNIIYCCALGNSVPPKLLKSTDAGLTWTVIVSATGTGLGGSSTTSGLGMSNGQGFYDFAIMVDPANIDNVIVATTSSYKSTDGGYNFSPLGGYAGGTISMHVDIQCMQAMGSDAFISSDGSMLYSSDFFTDNANAQARNRGITGSDYWGFGQGWQEDITTGGRYHNGNDAMYVDNYGAGNSLSMGGGESVTGHVFPGRERTVGHDDIGVSQIPSSFAGDISYNILQNNKWPKSNGYNQFQGKLFFHPWYRDVYYVGADSILWKSNNAGRSYSALKNFGAGDEVWRFDMPLSNVEVMYVLTKNGIYKTIDNGINWTGLSLPVTYQYYNADIAVNPANENEVYISMANGGVNDKVFKSTDGGQSWSNYTGSTIAGKYIFSLLFQGGTNSGIYASTQDNPAKIYYRNNSLPDWVDFSTGLFPNHLISAYPILFYRDNKIRVPGRRGIMESPLYSQGVPIAQAMCNTEYLGCAGDTVEFYDYSILNYTGANWFWTFPGAAWVSSQTDRNPKVLYSTPGNYDVTLTVSDAFGSSDTKTFQSMVKFPASYCEVDSTIGKCIEVSHANKNISIGTVNINSNTFSISTWVKPNGIQQSFGQVIGHYGCPGSPGNGIGYGITFSGYTPNLQLCYTDDQVGYGNYSGLLLDSNAWNNVVLTYSPTEVKLYLNGVAANVNTNSMPALDLSLTPFYLNPDIHSQGAAFNGLIDEVKIYNYTLSQEEVREKMHLIQSNPLSEIGLLKYIQFNQFDPNTSSIFDVINSTRTQTASNSIVTSTAPVSTGTVDRNTSVSNAGLNSFPDANVDLYLPASGNYPNGEVVAFHLRSNPDQNPDSLSIVPGYFIFNNYGTNQQITAPDSIIFYGLRNAGSSNQAEDFKLYKRNAFDFGNTWGTAVDSASSFNFIDTTNSQLSFSGISNISSIEQFSISHVNAILSNIQKPISSVLSSISAPYPNPARNVVYLNIETIKDNSAHFTIYDIRGRVVHSVTQSVRGGKNEIMLILPKLSEGIYDLNIFLKDDITVNKKITIM